MGELERSQQIDVLSHGDYEAIINDLPGFSAEERGILRLELEKYPWIKTELQKFNRYEYVEPKEYDKELLNDIIETIRRKLETINEIDPLENG